MRRKTFTVLLFMVVAYVMASVNMPLFKSSKKKPITDSLTTNDSLKKDSAGTVAVDTTKMDSLQLAIYHHNKQIDDSIRLDSLNRKKSTGIEAPVVFAATDSMIYNALSKTAHLYGSSNVKYTDMDLKSEKIYMSLDSNIVHATGIYADSTKTTLSGTPVFQMGADSYESDTMAFNFKTKKGLIRNVYTQQEDGFLRSEISKRNDKGEVYLQHGRYTTCDAEHPDFYIALSRAKVRPGKDVVFGPAYLVVADVPLPLAIPYGFFPFTKSYSSGLIMPTYGDESSRGFYLRDGGYYFAINDKWDLKLIGEIYTKGSWGVSVASNYRKRYRYSGKISASFQDTRTGDKGLPDYSKQKSFKIQWSHRQDQKANPFSNFAASVNYTSSNYERNNLTSFYNPQLRSQSTRTSSVSWSTMFSSIGLSLSSTANVSQNTADSTISMSLPDLNISLSKFYPFKRRYATGKERWYEKISMSYTGQLSNSISTKEDKILHSNLIKDWKNGMRHNIPISANFSVLNYINLTPSFNFTDRMYTNKVKRSWNKMTQTEVADTTYGFHNVYDWNLSLTANTTVYVFYTPSKKIFGDKIQAIRHVITPSIGFTYAPDFGSHKYGYYDSYLRTKRDGSTELVEYSPFQNGLYGIPGRGKSGNLNFSLGNKIEMKVKSDDDSTGYKKKSIIDELNLSMSYNMAAKVKPLSDLFVKLRLKWWKNYEFNMDAQFASYAYDLDKEGNPYVGNRTYWGMGKFGRFLGMSQRIDYTLTPEKIRKLFNGGEDNDKDSRKRIKDEDGIDTDIESNIDEDLANPHTAKKKASGGKAETDQDGFMKFSMPWSLTFGYGITLTEDLTKEKFNKKTMRYPYKLIHTLNINGNIRISDGWNITMRSGYDFERHAMSLTTASLQRDLHCFNMSCEIALAPYTSYNFTFRCNASTLTDALKYDKRSETTNTVKWY
ncbi:putative LPS assembly protein LptD [Prevotella sp.]|uniref:putative LPS assembly protein LptD n=1 Tax=Prevotella sp. TaxID=59823 RepID=UPI002F94F62D